MVQIYEYILYFVLMFQSMSDIEIKLLLDHLPTNPYNIYSVIFSDRKEITEVIGH